MIHSCRTSCNSSWLRLFHHILALILDIAENYYTGLHTKMMPFCHNLLCYVGSVQMVKLL